MYDGFHSIGWIHRQTYLEYVHNNIVPIYCQLQTVFSPQIIVLYFMTQQRFIQKGK